MVVAVTILLSLVTIFLDSFFVALAGFRIFPVLNFILYDKIKWKYLLLFLVLVSFVLDVIYHYVLGTNLFVLAIILLAGRAISLFAPLGYNLVGYIVKCIFFFLYYVLLALIPSLISQGVWGELTWALVGGYLLKSLFSLGLCLVFDILWNRLRQRDDSTKLKLRR